jgi:hypothetical protein
MCALLDDYGILREEKQKIQSDKTMSPPNENTAATAIRNNASMAKKSNQELTDKEKLAKRNLKKRLKQQARIKKLETRLKHAISRRDKVVEEATRQELDAYSQQLLQEEGSILHTPDMNTDHDGSIVTSSTMPQEESPTVQNCRIFLEENIYHLLIRQCKHYDQTGDKKFQTAQARTLLRNMTKGTQTESMFDNRSSLVGYTRQKFIERAMLAASSLDKLDNNPTTSESKTIFQQVLDAQVICSIGCGPGCDASGILALQQVYQKRPTSVLLLDFVIDQWKDAILDPLTNILVPESVDNIHTAFCDIRLSLYAEGNSLALAEMTRGGGSEDNRTTEDKQLDIDLVLISYVLTETRGKWRTFMTDLFRLLRSGTMLLLSEPTAWQLHHLLDIGKDRIDCHEWLDSSRNTPELQPLENRVGPAVLLLRVQ